eukprot:4500373-Alexandrium_andersonii.AAC.1
MPPRPLRKHRYMTSRRANRRAETYGQTQEARESAPHCGSSHPGGAECLNRLSPPRANCLNQQTVGP